MKDLPASLAFLGGLAQLSILVASSLVPFRLNWKEELGSLKKLHRQMYWIYGGYVVLSIIAFGVVCITLANEVGSGSPLARAFCGYIAIFWGIRLGLQPVMDVKEHLTVWWLKAGYHLLSLLFLALTINFAWLALRP
mgnify:CR=1